MRVGLAVGSAGCDCCCSAAAAVVLQQGRKCDKSRAGWLAWSWEFAKFVQVAAGAVLQQCCRRV